MRILDYIGNVALGIAVAFAAILALLVVLMFV